MALPAIAAAQGHKHPPALDRVSAEIKDYLRGVTENRFDVRYKISSFDITGKLKKVRNHTHRLEFTQGCFRGAGLSEDTDWLSTIHISRASRATVGLELFTDWDGLFTPAFAFSNKQWTLEPSTLSDGAVKVVYRLSGTCVTFEWSGY